MSRDGRDDAQDIDRAFADIMSRWNETANPDHAPPTASDEAPPELTEPLESTEPPTPAEPPPAPAPPAAEGDAPPRPRTVEEVFGSVADTGWRIHTPPEERDDDFVPPRPAPPSGNDVTFWLALAGIVGGPLWIIYLALAAPYSSRLWFALALGATLGGFALMVMRLPARHDPEDDDDGAVV